MLVPASEFGFTDKPAAIGEALGALGIWLGPWALLAGAIVVAHRVRGTRHDAGGGPLWTPTDTLLAACVVGYLGLLIAMRTSQAFHPLDDVVVDE